MTIIAAHRGGAALNPENSFAAFRTALALGADQIETDVHLSRDNVAIVMHDATLDRTTTGIGAVRSFTADELARVALHGVDEHVAPLDALLALIAPTNIGLRLELKLDRKRERYPDQVAIVGERLRAFNLLDRATISSFDWASLQLVHQAMPLVPRLGLVKRERFIELGGLDAVLREAKHAGLAEIALHDEQFDPSMMAVAAKHGTRLGLFAVNTERAIERALASQVSAFTTDRPDLALAARARRGAAHRTAA